MHYKSLLWNNVCIPIYDYVLTICYCCSCQDAQQQEKVLLKVYNTGQALGRIEVNNYAI
jgi:hypothetical protein